MRLNIYRPPCIIDETEIMVAVVCNQRAYMVPRDVANALAKHATTQAEVEALRAALQGLFDHCAMVHKHWGDGDNTKEADAAQKTARAALADQSDVVSEDDLARAQKFASDAKVVLAAARAALDRGAK